jgi:hypothetical protein
MMRRVPPSRQTGATHRGIVLRPQYTIDAHTDAVMVQSIQGRIRM